MQIQELRKLMIDQMVLLENSFEQIAIRRNAGAFGEFHAKPKGEPEYSIKSSSVIVIESLFEGKLLTELEYINY
jgi:hypothetical protein